jgi:hypothetical protein
MLERLRAIALWFTEKDTWEAGAKDLVEDALVEVMDPERMPWERGAFLTHMTFVMRHVWHTKKRLLVSRTEVVDSEIAKDENTLSKEPRADDELHRRRKYGVWRELGQKLVAKIADKYPRAVQVFELAAKGIEEPAEQAEALSCPVEEIYEAMGVLKRYGRGLREEWEQEEERRMKEAHERAMKKRAEPRRADEDDEP